MNAPLKVCPHCSQPMPEMLNGVLFDREAGVVVGAQGDIARLTGSESKLFAALWDVGLGGRLATKERIYDALYWDVGEANEPQTKVIDVYVCKIRRKLPPDIAIETIWGRGWRLVPGKATA